MSFGLQKKSYWDKYKGLNHEEYEALFNPPRHGVWSPVILTDGKQCHNCKWRTDRENWIGNKEIGNCTNSESEWGGWMTCGDDYCDHHEYMENKDA